MKKYWSTFAIIGLIVISYFAANYTFSGSHLSNQNFFSSLLPLASGQSPNQGLAGYWKFDETGGTVAHDSSGNGYEATIHGGSWSKGVVNGALELHGANTYAEILNSESLSPNMFTIEGWVFFNSFPAVGQYSGWSASILLEKGVDNSKGTFSLGLNRNQQDPVFQLTIFENTQFNVQSKTKVELGKWYYLAGIYDGSNMSLYVNGQLENQATANVARTQSNAKIFIGKQNYPGYEYWLDGRIDELKIYNYARASNEILSDYASFAVSPTASPTLSPTASPTLSPTASPTLSPTASPTSRSIDYGLVSLIAFVSILLVSTTIVVKRLKKEPKRQAKQAESEKLEGAESERQRTEKEGAVEQIAMPTFSPPSNTYSNAQYVAIYCITTGATIRYTINGAEPTAFSTVYLSPIPVTKYAILKAKGFKMGMVDSLTASAVYTILQKPPENIEAFFEVLGVHYNSNRQQVKDAYRELAKKWASDKFSGDSPGAKELRDKEMSRINVAYEEICKSKGWPK